MRQRGSEASGCVLVMLLAVVAAFTAAGCAGEGTETSIPTTTMGGSSGALADIQRDIFSPSCATLGCHDVITQAGSLVLSDVTTSFNQLVGRTSQCSARIRVVSGQPESSYLLDKLGASVAAPCGSLMPLGLPLLSATELQMIRDWISNDAPAGVSAAGAGTDGSTNTTTSTTVNSAVTTSTSSSSTSSTSTTTLRRVLQLRD